MSKEIHIHFDDKVQCKDNHCDSGKEITTTFAAKEISHGDDFMALEVGNWVEPVTSCASGLCVWNEGKKAKSKTESKNWFWYVTHKDKKYAYLNM